jgi:hypothetical protein
VNTRTWAAIERNAASAAPAAAIGTVIGSDRFYEEEGAQGALLFGVNVRATLAIQRDRLRDISQRPECNLSPVTRL